MKRDISRLVTFATMHSIPICDSETQQFIKEFLISRKPVSCLEIWSAIWFSTIIIASTIEDWRWKLISFEYSYPSYMRACNNIHTLLLTNTILYYHHFSKFDIGKLWKTFDFIFIDGEKGSYLSYYLDLLPYLRNNCILIFDDVLQYTEQVLPLISYLHVTKTQFKIHDLWNGDWLLILETK